MEKQKQRAVKKSSIRLLAFSFLVQIFSLSLAQHEPKIEISTTQVEIGETINIKILVDKNNYKNILKRKNKIELKSESDFEIINYNLKDDGKNIEATFELKLNALGENYFYIFINNKKINHSEIKINVRLAEINTETEFSWKFFRIDETNISPPIEQGKKYFLVLYGNFLNTKNRIVKIEYECPKTILLEENTTLKINQTNLTQVIAFEFMPLHYETVFLPNIDIFYTMQNSINNKITVSPVAVKTIPSETKTLKTPIPQNLITEKSKPLKKYSVEELALAKKVYDFRTSLSENIFQVNKLKELKLAETELGLEKTFFPYIRIVYFCVIILCVLVVIILLWRYKFKSIIANLIYILLFITALFFTQKTFAQYGVLFSECEVLLKNIPEENAQSSLNLQLGETVIIEESLNNWYYIKTAENKTGWVMSNEILKIN